MRPKRIVVATVTAVLLACAVPAAALAETRVVLENESSGTEVHTGEASFTNTTNTSSDSTAFDPPAVTSGVATTGDQTAGTVQSIAPVSTGAVGEPEAVQSQVQSAGRDSGPSIGAIPAFTII